MRINYKSQKGFALMLSIFLVIGLEMMVVGNLLQTMRQKREVQRSVTEVQLHNVANAVVDRGLRIFRDYMVTSNTYPSQNSQGIVSGSEFSGTDFKPFSEWLSGWYDTSFKSMFPDSYEAGLNQIKVDASDIIFKEIERGPGNSWRRYRVSVVARSGNSKVEKSMNQDVKITMGQFFAFSVFSDSDIEITAGPNLTLQGPIFSNKNIYMMNQAASTLTLKRAKNYNEASNPEPYVLNGAGNIYFGWKTAFAKNYILTDPNFADLAKNLPDFYTKAPGGLEVEDEIYLGDKVYNPKPSNPFAPMMYAFWNGAALGNNAASHKIVVENSGGTLVTLTHPNVTHMVKIDTYSKWAMLAQKYKDTGIMSFSGAIDSENFPELSESWSMENPQSSAAVNPAWAVKSPVDTVADGSHGVLERLIPIGDPNNPSGTHLLIEPLTSIFPKNTIGTRASVDDSEDVIKRKFQANADMNIYIRIGSESKDYDALKNAGVIPILGSNLLYDYRVKYLMRPLVIDMEKFVKYIEKDRPDLSEKGIMIYVHVYPVGKSHWSPILGNVLGSMGPHSVKVINAKRIPRHGFTIVTNGRLFVQGDYNTYSYDLCPDPEHPALEGCHVSDANHLAKWDAEDFKVPSAALFSDSLVFLSNDWKDSYGSSTVPSSMALKDRVVKTPLMVNAAIGTGMLQSQLERTLPQYLKGTRAFDPRGVDSDNDGFFNSGGSTLQGNSYFYCNDATYKKGKQGVSADCEFYYNENNKSYFVNKESKLYLNAVDRGLAESAGPVPIYTTYASLIQSEFKDQTTILGRASKMHTLDPAPLLFPISVYRLDGDKYLMRPTAATEGYWGQSCSNVCPVNDSIPCQGVPGGTCAGGKACLPGAGEGFPPVCSGCRVATVRECKQVWVAPVSSGFFAQNNTFIIDNRPASGLSVAAYAARPSGGIENLINLQEVWDSIEMRVSGTFSTPWNSREVNYENGNKAFFYIPTAAGDANAIYSAPIRKYDFNEEFQKNPPPGTPGVFSIKRERIEA